VSVITAIAWGLRRPADAAAAMAVRSAHVVRVGMQFSTLAPTQTEPSSMSTAAPTGNPL
jgi:hypothetical protein